MKHVEGTFSSSDGLELYCQAWHPDAPAKARLLIVHGLGEHSGRYMNLVSVLVRGGYEVFAFDNRGHGKSRGQRGHVDSFADFRNDLAAFVDHLNEAGNRKRPLFVMGHSLGGLIVLDSVIQGMAGIEGVVVSSPALDDRGIPAFLRAASKILSKVWPTLSVKTRLDTTGISRDPEVITAYQKDPLVHHVGTPRLATESSKAMAYCLGNADKISIPILMIHGTDDKITSAVCSRNFFDKVTFQNKSYIAYEHGYHESHNDLDKDRVTADIRNWLDDQLAWSVAN